MERLVVENDEAFALARELAERRGISVEDAVVSSLRSAVMAVRPAQRPAGPVRVPTIEELTPKQRADIESMGDLVRELRPFIKPGATSDHKDMYDEHGLPI